MAGRSELITEGPKSERHPTEWWFVEESLTWRCQKVTRHRYRRRESHVFLTFEAANGRAIVYCLLVWMRSPVEQTDAIWSSLITALGERICGARRQEHRGRLPNFSARPCAPRVQKPRGCATFPSSSNRSLGTGQDASRGPSGRRGIGARPLCLFPCIKQQAEMGLVSLRCLSELWRGGRKGYRAPATAISTHHVR